MLALCTLHGLGELGELQKKDSTPTASPLLRISLDRLTHQKHIPLGSTRLNWYLQRQNMNIARKSLDGILKAFGSPFQALAPRLSMEVGR